MNIQQFYNGDVFNLEWLEKQLKAQHYTSAKEIYLGVCDKDNKLSLFAAEE